MVLFAWFLATTSASAQNFTTMHSFNATDGEHPNGGLVQGLDGSLYGTTRTGGDFGGGTFFKMTPSGTLTTLYNFCSQTNCTDGTEPGALVLASSGVFYGMTAGGGDGANGQGGTVFRITPKGALTTIYNFCSQSNCTDGATPTGLLVQATDGMFYGTTASGGTGVSTLPEGCTGCGIVFKLTRAGAFTKLYDFCSQPNCTDGFGTSGLVQATYTDGNFYGTTEFGSSGDVGNGTVFRITSGGTLSTLYDFCLVPGCPDGGLPGGPLVQGTDGNLYGTSHGAGGEFGSGTIFYVVPTTGAVDNFYIFCVQGSNCGIGPAFPDPWLVQSSDGNLYGTTSQGGTEYQGVIFKIAPHVGSISVLHNFCSQKLCADGQAPEGGLMQASGGNLFGATYGRRVEMDGTIFRLSLGIGPFVETIPSWGNTGAAVKILGTNLTSASSVSFNGTPATFKVVSGSEITTTVPDGATTGNVTVTTPKGTLISNNVFQITF